MLRLESIEPSTLELLKRIQELPAFSETRLVGGTSLAMQLGHRISVDLDLFGSWPTDSDLFAELRKVGHVRKSSGTPDGKMQFFIVDGIKVDCVTYDMFPWLDGCVEESGVRLAGIKDIAAMKINAITNRGTRKDFVDMAVLLQHYSLAELFDFYRLKYVEAEQALAIRSLVYFVDAESQPMPRMLVPFDWTEAKTLIRTAVRTMFYTKR